VGLAAIGNGAKLSRKLLKIQNKSGFFSGIAGLPRKYNPAHSVIQMALSHKTSTRAQDLLALKSKSGQSMCSTSLTILPRDLSYPASSTGLRAVSAAPS
jgi:hypothetical protein